MQNNDISTMSAFDVAINIKNGERYGLNYLRVIMGGTLGFVRFDMAKMPGASTGRRWVTVHEGTLKDLKGDTLIAFLKSEYDKIK